MAATQYAHGLLLENLFGPSIADCWAVRAKNKAKTAVWVAVAAKPEVEIWRRPKKINSLTLVSYSLLQTLFLLGRTVLP